MSVPGFIKGTYILGTGAFDLLSVWYMRQEIAAKTKDGSASQGLAGAKDEIQKSREQATQYLAEIVAFRGDSCGLEAPVLGLQGSARRSCQTGKDEEFIRKSFTKTSEEIQDILSFAVNLVKDGGESTGASRELEAKLGFVTMTHDRVVDDLIVSIQTNGEKASRLAESNAEKVEYRADELYAWSKTFLPDMSSPLSRVSKVSIMPYILSMAYAIRVKLDTVASRIVLMGDEEGTESLELIGKDVEAFIQVLQSALKAIIRDTGLLEVALDYYMPLAILATLIQALKIAPISPRLSDSDWHLEGEAIAVWDDGLSGIRAAVSSGASDDALRTIQLDNLEESLWWVKFTGQSPRNLKNSDLKEKIELDELCRYLEADETKGTTTAASSSLAPEHKAALMQLPPVEQLRSTLDAKLAPVLEAPHRTFRCVQQGPYGGIFAQRSDGYVGLSETTFTPL